MADQAMMERDPAKRIALYHAIQRNLLEGGPMAYYAQAVRAIAVRKEVSRESRRLRRLVEVLRHVRRELTAERGRTERRRRERLPVTWRGSPAPLATVRFSNELAQY